MNKKIQKLIKLSDGLDKVGLYNDSSEVDSLIKKVANPAATQAVGFDPLKTLDYMKGLDSMFSGMRKRDYYNPDGSGEIGTYDELQKAKQEAQTMYSKESPNNIVRSVIKKMLNEVFKDLTCIKNHANASTLNKSGKYVFKSEVELKDNIFVFTQPITEVLDTITNKDQTIKKCLDSLFVSGQDLADPKFSQTYEKYKSKAMEELEDSSIFDAGKKYKLLDITISFGK